MTAIHPVRSAAEMPWRRAARAKTWLGRCAQRVTAPAALRRLAEMPLTVLGGACIDAGVYTQSLTAGLIVTGLSLIGIEYLIAED